MPATRTIPPAYLSFDSAGALTLASASGQRMNLNAAKFLLGTSGVDSGALLQIGTNTTTSAGGMVFGTDTFFHRSEAGGLVLNGNTTVAILRGYNGATQMGYIGFASSYGEINQVSGPLYLKANNNIAVTFDAALRTILSGALRLNHAYTAGVGAATGYLTVQDSTGTTYKIPVLA